MGLLKQTKKLLYIKREKTKSTSTEMNSDEFQRACPKKAYAFIRPIL